MLIKNTADGVLQIIEIKGNSIIDESDGEKIKSVGDKIEGENLYKISLLSTNGLSKSNINYKECEVEILLPVQLERVDDIYDRLIFNTEGVWIVEKNVNAVIENGIIVNKQVESNIISLPDLELSPLYSFKGDTTIDFLTEVNGSIKVNVPKALKGIVNSHTNQINDLNVKLDKLSSQLAHIENNLNFISIKYFNAIEDGVTDDTVALENTILYCKENKKDLILEKDKIYKG